MENSFNLKKFLAEGKLLKEDQDLASKIANLEKQLSILKTKQQTGSKKLTPAQLKKVKSQIRNVYEESDYDEIDTSESAIYLIVTALLNNKWKGKEITDRDLDNNLEELVQSLGYENVDDFESYTDSIANQVMSGKMEEGKENINIASFLNQNKNELLQALASKFDWIDEDYIEDYSNEEVETGDDPEIAGFVDSGMDFSFNPSKAEEEGNFTIKVNGKTVYGTVYNY